MSASSTNANSTFNDRVTKSGPLAVDASFQFVDVRELGTILAPEAHSTRCSHPGWGLVS